MGLFLVLIDAYEDPLGEDFEEDGSKLIRIDGDVIFGGIFPMHEQVNKNNRSINIDVYQRRVR